MSVLIVKKILCLHKLHFLGVFMICGHPYTNFRLKGASAFVQNDNFVGLSLWCWIQTQFLSVIRCFHGSSSQTGSWRGHFIPSLSFILSHSESAACRQSVCLCVFSVVALVYGVGENHSANGHEGDEAWTPEQPEAICSQRIREKEMLIFFFCPENAGYMKGTKTTQNESSKDLICSYSWL